MQSPRTRKHHKQNQIFLKLIKVSAYKGIFQKYNKKINMIDT